MYGQRLMIGCQRTGVKNLGLDSVPCFVESAALPSHTLAGARCQPICCPAIRVALVRGCQPVGGHRHGNQEGRQDL